MAKLKHVRDGQVFLIDIDEEYTIIGRSRACDLTIPGVSDISREHTCIRHHEDGHYSIKDLGSTNGTFLNGNRIKTEVKLSDNDKIRLGKTASFVFMAADRISMGADAGTEADLEKTMMIAPDANYAKALEEMEAELKEKSYQSLMEDIVKTASRPRPKH